MTGIYQGAPWRSRFLRAPKIALELAADSDFVALGELATVRLGLKTGADEFFLMTGVSGPPPEQAALGLRTPRTLLVRGLDGWEGSLDARDLLPAVRNPHELFDGDHRRLTIPRRTNAFYLFPRDRRPEAQLAEYVRFGEQEAIHQRQLVRDNAGAQWYRQSRGVSRPQWALPYNSAYDYGAWRNPGGAVINGRFVGVVANGDVDELLLGAVLNSTWVMTTRLLEGVATGVEGAYDVGPTAARFTAVPDVRAFAPERTDAIRSVFLDLLSKDAMPPGPDRHGRVAEGRNALDLAILVALGASGGKASALAGSVYESYARWRRAVEDVEQRMRVFRGAMARAGGGRGATPAVAAARRVWEELAADVPALPREGLRAGDVLESVEFDGHVDVLVDRPLFDQGIVTGREGATVDLRAWERVRYFGMLVAIGFRSPFAVPVDADTAGSIADDYETKRDELTKRVADRAKSFVADQAVSEVVDGVLRHWHRKCRAGGQGAPGLASASPAASSDTVLPPNDSGT